MRCLSSADQNGQQDQAREGSVTVIGAVSPPGGDFSEPVTQNSLRIAGTFWGLDAQLAYSRHFPAINWLTSYSLYLDALKSWYDQKLSEEFLQMRAELLEILQREDELAKTVTERSGRVRCLSSADQNEQHEDQAREGSVTVIGAVSPPGGDFSEPVTQNSLRIAGTFWGLDAQLAYSRHFPAINWLTSYSLYLDALKSWYDQKLSEEFLQMRAELLEILQREDELAKTVQLVGRESLSDPDKLLLQIARTIRDDFLRQSAFHEIEAYCPLQKQFYMMKAILSFYQHCQGLLGKRPYAEIEARPGWEQLARMRYFENENFSPKYEQLLKELVADGGAVQQGVS